MASFEIAPEAQPIFQLGERHERVSREEMHAKTRLWRIWAEKGRDPALGIKLGLLPDPREEAQLKADLIALEKEQSLLTQGTYDEIDEAAMKYAVETVMGRYKLRAGISQNVATALGKLYNTQLEDITSFASFLDTAGSNNAVMATLYDGIKKYAKSPAGVEWASKPGNEGKSPLFNDNMKTKEEVRSVTSQHFTTLFARMPAWEQEANGTYDLSLVKESEQKALAELKAFNDGLIGESGHGVAKWVSGTDGGKREQDVRLALALADKFTSAGEVGDQNDIIRSARKAMPGVVNAGKIANEIEQTFHQYSKMIRDTSDVAKESSLENALQQMKLDTRGRLSQRSAALKRQILSDPFMQKVADKIGADTSSVEGRTQVIKFISQAGFKYAKQRSKGTAGKGLRDLRKGNINLMDFYMGEVRILPRAEGATGADVASPSSVPTAPVGGVEAVEAVEAADGVAPVEEVEEDVDLLRDEVATEDESLPTATDVAAFRLRQEEDEIKDLAALDAEDEFEPLIEQVSEQQDVTTQGLGRTETYPDAYATQPIRVRAPGSAPGLIQSHKAGRPKEALARVRKEQRRQAVLRNIGLAGAAHQIPQSVPAEGVAPDLRIGATDMAYAAALDLQRRAADAAAGLNPTVLAQKMAADGLKKAEQE